MAIEALVAAIQSLNAEDALRARLGLEQWRTIAPYLARDEIRTGDLLVKQGDGDRTMFLLEQGTLQVFAAAPTPGPQRIAILRPGSVVGEPGLFTDGPRMANVEAMTPAVVWALRGPRLDELAQRMPALAYELLRAAGAVMAARMRANVLKQTPFT
jgi:CRP-like cAMP-binding protein